MLKFNFNTYSGILEYLNGKSFTLEEKGIERRSENKILPERKSVS